VASWPGRDGTGAGARQRGGGGETARHPSLSVKTIAQGADGAHPDHSQPLKPSDGRGVSG
jgi:hypothetical protein